MSNVSARPEKRRGRPPKSRKDPAFKPTTGGMYGMQLEKKDPSKHYVFVDPNLKDWYAHYVGMGYTPERKTQDGPNLVAGSTAKDGDIFESHGCVLMSIDKKRKEEMDEEGLAYARGRMNEVRKASQGKAIRREYVGSFPDANIEFDVNIPSREREL